MPRYKVIQGKHVDEDGNVYARGQVVDSGQDLVAMFPQKFERVGGDEEDEAPPPEAPAGPSTLDTPETKKTEEPPPRAARAGYAPRRPTKPAKPVEKDDFD